jgi:hypothetical protein
MSKTPICPFLKKACIEHECMLYTHVTMQHPQTGASTDQFGCAVAWLPILMVEGARHTRGVQAAVESTRHEITQRQDTFNQLAIDASQKKKQLTDG